VTGARWGCVLVAALLGSVPFSLAVAAPPASDEKLRQLMQQARPQPAASQAGATAVREAGAVPPERLKERDDLLKAGEAALTRMDAIAAIDSFDRAALILHAADTEIALVRAYMQSGQYRRALAFGAHTAGAHLDVIGGAALYAWLLHAGGQVVIAQRLLAEAEARMPKNAMLASVQAQLNSGVPLATKSLLALPTRLAPYGSSRGLPPSARGLGSGLLINGGTQALVPLALLPRSGNFWLRNGLGQLSRGTLQRRLQMIGLALVRLESPLPAPEDLWIAAADAFPGSVGYAVEYVPSRDSTPAWPMLRTGFLGAALGDGGERLLGIDMPAGPRGGPMFDAAGRLTGLALPGPIDTKGKLPPQDRLIPVSALQSQLKSSGQATTMLGSPPPADLPRPAAVDRIYEISLKASLQLIGVP
jgi:tetratricopeptide (TPR) repeat protein